MSVTAMPASAPSSNVSVAQGKRDTSTPSDPAERQKSEIFSHSDQSRTSAWPGWQPALIHRSGLAANREMRQGALLLEHPTLEPSERDGQAVGRSEPGGCYKSAKYRDSAHPEPGSIGRIHGSKLIDPRLKFSSLLRAEDRFTVYPSGQRGGNPHIRKILICSSKHTGASAPHLVELHARQGREHHSPKQPATKKRRAPRGKDCAWYRGETV
jgi:hypothetical protein